MFWNKPKYKRWMEQYKPTITVLREIRDKVLRLRAEITVHRPTAHLDDSIHRLIQERQQILQETILAWEDLTSALTDTIWVEHGPTDKASDKEREAFDNQVQQFFKEIYQ